MILLLAIAALGGLGAGARVLVEGRVALPAPLATMVVNLSGAAALGVLDGAGVGGDALTLAGAATLGGYTTFSGWMLHTDRPARAGARRLAFFSLAGSLLGGLTLILAGRALGRAL